MKHHLGHLLMCAPMLLIAGIAIASGASVAFLLPAIACMLMMAMMMGGGSHGDHGRHDHADNPPRS